MEVKKDNRGGARPGGGRKKSDRIRATFKLDPDVVELLSTVDNKSDLVNQAIREYITKEA